ncbi:glutathione transferase GST 23-like [Zingiber officinale]|uniref:glutathione transferase n=1 Tax=Zingiber officinale TaxID=94328 RepID=A0A8J5EVJ0_ZINOF|nr:glutathione transferase GST 23-like [Zingiber officinale]KAG6473971.1 hypothetical protein ZIOFF_067891 [Zingiber officinale]
MAEEEGEKEVTLLGTWSSPFVLRVKWALRIKGVEYTYVEEDLRNKSPQLLQYNPVHKKVPVLVHRGRAIAESSVILHYIDEAWPHHPLLPHHPYEKAMARFWCKFEDDKLSPPLWRVLTTQAEEQREAHASAIESLGLLENELEGKKFFGGQTIGLVDVWFGALAYIIPIYEEITGLKLVEQRKLPRLCRWMEEFLSSPAVEGTLPPKDMLLPRYAAMREAFLAKAKRPEQQ